MVGGRSHAGEYIDDNNDKAQIEQYVEEVGHSHGEICHVARKGGVKVGHVCSEDDAVRQEAWQAEHAERRDPSGDVGKYNTAPPEEQIAQNRHTGVRSGVFPS